MRGRGEGGTARPINYKKAAESLLRIKAFEIPRVLEVRI